VNRKAALYFAVITVAFFIPLSWGDAFIPAGFLYRTPLWYDPSVPLEQFDLFDSVIAFYPYQALLSQGIEAGEFPFWNPYNFGGHPIAFNGQSGYFYPPRLLLISIFPVWLAHGLSLALHTFVAGFAAWLLGRRIGLSPVGAALFGTTWMLNPYVMSWLEMDHMSTCAALTPLALLAVDKCRRDWSGAAWLGLCMGLLLLSGHLQYVLYAIGTVVITGLLLLGYFGCPKVVWPRLGVAAILTGLVASPMLLPSAYYLSTSQRPTLSLDFLVGIYREFLSSCWTTTIFPEAFGNGNEFAVRRIFGGGEFIYPELCLYFGVITLVLAILAVLSKGLGRWLVLTAILVLLIPSTPLYSVIMLLPGLDRVSSTRSIQVVHFLIALAAGFGVDTLDQKKLRNAASAVASTLFLMGVGWAYRACGRSGEEVLQSLMEDRAIRLPKTEMFLSVQEFQGAALRGFDSVYSWHNSAIWLPLACLFLCVVSIQLSRRPKHCLLILVLVDLFVLGRNLNTHQPHELLFTDNPTTSLLRQCGPERVMGVGSIKPNTLQPLRVADIAGYDSFYPKNTSQYLAYILHGDHVPGRTLPAQVFPMKRYQTPLVDLLGVRYFVAYPGQTLEKKVLVQQAPLPVFENPSRVPRAFLVNQFEIEPDNGPALEMLEEGTVDPRQSVILDREPKLVFGQGDAGQARIVSYGLNEVRVLVDAASPAVLVLTDSYLEGWEVEVDGSPAELLRANVMFRGVVVPQGRHTVRFRFQPIWFRIGLALGVSGLIGILLLLWLGRKRHD
jgi:hypothetical protein